jgi:hypothetical protein
MKTKLLFVTMFLIACFKMGGLTAQTLVGYWNFNTGANGVAWNAPIPATTGAATITAGTWTWGDLLFTDGFAGSTLNGISGETAGASLSLRNNAMNGNYIQFEFSMTGFTDLEISYWSRRTTTGFNSNQWSWSTDGLAFTDFGDVINPSSASGGAIVAITAPAALDNAANVYLRYTLDGATAATGNNRIDNLQLNAVQIGAVPLPTDFAATASGNDAIDLAWNLNTANNPVLLAWSADGVFGDPTGVYNPGDPVVGGGIVLYAGSNTSYNHTLLNPGTVYYYALWSKDGANYSEAATAMAETWPLPSYTTLPYTETFDADLGDCYAFSVSGNTRFWMHGAFDGNGYALMNGFNSGELEEDWLILPGINLDNYSAPVMSFETSWNFGSEDDDNYLKLFYSTNYTGVGSPAQCHLD